MDELELYITRTAKQHNINAFYRLRSVSPISKILALVILYDLGYHRFPRAQDFVPYCSFVKCAKESAKKRHGLASSGDFP